MRCRMNRKTWNECVEDDMIVLGLNAEWAVFMDMWSRVERENQSW